MIRDAQAADGPALAAIYNHYILHTTVTFEEEALSGEAMAARVADHDHRHPWLVLEDGGQIWGYAYAAPWKTRAAYRHSVEMTVYLADGTGRRGLGTALYRDLLSRLRLPGGPHAAIAGIALPNAASQGFHEAFGFRQVALFREVGWKFGSWLDVGYWELLLGTAN